MIGVTRNIYYLTVRGLKGKFKKIPPPIVINNVLPEYRLFGDEK